MNDYNGLDPDVAAGLDALVVEVARVMRSKRRTCVTCLFFNATTEGCGQAQGNRPPAKVIAYGCQAYQGDGQEEQAVSHAAVQTMRVPPAHDYKKIELDDDEIPF